MVEVLLSGNKGLFYFETLKIPIWRTAKQRPRWVSVDYPYKAVMHPGLTYNLQIFVHIKLLTLHFLNSLICAPLPFYKISFEFLHIIFLQLPSSLDA